MEQIKDEELKLTDLIDIAALQTIQDAFSKATGMAALTTDREGAVTKLSNPTDFCMKFTRPSDAGGARCNECDLKGGQEAARTGRPSVYYCHGGLVDFAAPIIVNGRHIGSLLGGQVLTEPADETKIRKIAAEIGVDGDEYVEAIRKVKIVPKESIDAAAELLFCVANTLSEAGYQKLKISSAHEYIKKSVSGLLESTDQIQDIMQEVSYNVGLLTSELDDYLVKTKEAAAKVKQSDKIVKYIQNISMQLTLLGFNASVEAKRAGLHGAGFNAIAKEMRQLSSESSEQTKMIDSSLLEIRKSTNESAEKFAGTRPLLEKSVESLQRLEDLINEISELTHSIKALNLDG